MHVLQTTYPNPSISVKLPRIYTHEAKDFKNKHLLDVRMLHDVWEPENMLEKEVSIISHWIGKYAKSKTSRDSKFTLFFKKMLILLFTNMNKYCQRYMVLPTFVAHHKHFHLAPVTAEHLSQKSRMWLSNTRLQSTLAHQHVAPQKE